MKIKRLHLKGLGEGGLFSKLSDHLFVTYTRTYIKCPVVSLQFRRLMRATLRFKLATVVVVVVWSLQTEDQTEKDSTFYHIVCSNVGKEANIHPRNLANFKVRSFTK